MWFLALLDGKTIPYALVRDKKIQALYHQRPEYLRNQFIEGLFDETLISKYIPFRFVPNNFPYFVEDGILHFVFWIRPHYDGDLSYSVIRPQIGKFVLSRFMKPLEFYYFKNSNENKSIQEIEHYHVFVKYSELF